MTDKIEEWRTELYEAIEMDSSQEVVFNWVFDGIKKDIAMLKLWLEKKGDVMDVHSPEHGTFEADNSAHEKDMQAIKEKLLKEINEVIDEVEMSCGDNQYDGGYRDALYMVKTRIIKKATSVSNTKTKEVIE